MVGWKNQAIRRSFGWILSLIVLAGGLSPQARMLGSLPDTIHLVKGESTRLELVEPFNLSVENGGAPVLSSTDERLGDVNDAHITLTGESEGNAQVVLKLLGMEVRRVHVDVQPSRVVIPGGHAIGVAIEMSGVLVIGASDVGQSVSPARRAGLKAGDRIVAVNGTAIKSAQHLSRMIERGGQAALTVQRGEDSLSIPVTPVQDGEGGAYRLGVWVRDSTAGVGTLSFYDPQSGMYGALGHAITDIDTGAMLAIGEGSIYKSRVIDILKSSDGRPGELMGDFISTGAPEIGSLTKNDTRGIYGALHQPLTNNLYPQGVPVAARTEITTGAATLLTTLDDEGIREYGCEITKLYNQNEPGQRSMVIKITDETLLERTGGIVQGMSGSPILQNGKLVGVVTHVYIDDTQLGYAVYAEWMIKECE
jgi:stage IV sporulation protein B